ncbi:hypothetical protein R1sor_003025 [Riccia sorocarpa]|uniref:Disease resistance R13L4/SHOC-2-like LRR domain-containing protein n=1 Tax=Riccia sorocarpa TaxID=122646 RepID=A0ABD3H0T2_9MARC
MISLEDLNIEVKGPQPVGDIFGHLQKLRRFRLVCRGIENNLVESWGKLTSLEYLLLRSRDRTSKLEVILDLESDRRSLDISLRGQLGPPGIFEPFPVFLTRVENFVLVQGQQTVGDTFGHLQKLWKFELVCSEIENSLVESFGKMINLEDLSITVQGQQIVRDTFGHLQKLRKFKSICNGVEDSLVESLGNMINLEDLTIEVQGQQTLRDIFGHLQNLRRFCLVCSGVENNLMGSLGELTSSEDLVLDVNSKHGNLDLQIGYGQWRPWTSRSLKIRLQIAEYQKAESSMLKWLGIRLNDQQAESSILEPSPVFLRKVGELDLNCVHGAQTAIVRDMIHLESVEIVVEGPGAVPNVFKDLQKLRIFFLKCDAVEDNLEGSFAALSSLQLLDLRCKTMEHFPHVFGCFSTLEQLRISCPSLQALPNTVGNFIGLRKFKMVATGVQSLPDSIGQLSQLQKLSLRGCNHLTTLPETLGQLTRLVSLKVRWCQNFNTLPETLGQLPRLTSLKVRWCQNFNSLPESAGELSSLLCLDLKGSGLHFLPDSIKNLSQLQLLNISGCSNLYFPLVTRIFPKLNQVRDGFYATRYCRVSMSSESD